MTPKIKELAIRAGFGYHISDCNFYESNGENYINEQISEFAALVAQEVFKMTHREEHETLSTAEYFKLGKEVGEAFGYPKNNSILMHKFASNMGISTSLHGSTVTLSNSECVS